MGIKFYCPSCDKRLNVKSFLAGKGGYCPHCQAKLQIPAESEPKRAKTAEAGASTILRQPDSRLPEVGSPARPVAPSAAQGNALGNGHAKAHANVASSGPAAAPVTPQSPALGPTPVHHPAPTGGAAPMTPQQGASAVSPYPAAYGGGAAPGPQGSVPAGYGAAPVHPAMAAPMAAPMGPAPITHVAPSPAVVDPISEAPHAVWYVRPPAGGQYGPAVGDIMRRWLAEGRVSGESLVWREGWPEWRKANKVFASLGAAPAAPAPSGAAPVTGAAPTPRRTIRSPRPRDSNAFAITAIIVLALASIALLAGLFWVLGLI